VLRTELDAELGLRKARAATLTLLALPGSTYIYQGEELGLPEVWDLPEEVLDDPVWENSGHTNRGRDGCRVPIPWSSSGPSLGFGSGAGWLPQPEYYADFAAEAQEGVPGSTLELYRTALALRRQHLVGDETLEWVELDGADPKSVLAFRRGSGVLCVVNFGDDPIDLPAGSLLVASVASVTTELPGNASAWIVPA
jgi:alpha-glucosidase